MVVERPQLADNPLDLLKNDPVREIPLLNANWGVLAGTATGFLSVLYSNWGGRRPIYSGVPRAVAITLLGGAIGYFADEYRSQYFADRDAGFRHYIELHPEDFPPYERKKYSEILEPWIPIRGQATL